MLTPNEYQRKWRNELSRTRQQRKRAKEKEHRTSCSLRRTCESSHERTCDHVLSDENAM